MNAWVPLNPMEIITKIIETVGPVLAAGLGTWIVARKKNKADAQKSELDAVQQAISIWRTLSQELESKLDSYRVEVERLRTEIANLRIENKRLLTELKSKNHKIDG